MLQLFSGGNDFWHALSYIQVRKRKTADEEDVMKTTLKRAAAAAAATMATAAPAFAAPTYTDHSGLLVWTFLGFCAVIVVAQVMPALMMMVGMAKGLGTETKEAKAHH